jgi:hypothetical protein
MRMLSQCLVVSIDHKYLKIGLIRAIALTSARLFLASRGTPATSALEFVANRSAHADIRARLNDCHAYLSSSASVDNIILSHFDANVALRFRVRASLQCMLARIEHSGTRWLDARQ